MMSLIETFWGQNLTKLVISPEVRPHLADETIRFLEEVGLPSSEAMFTEKANFRRTFATLPINALVDPPSIDLIGPYLFFGNQARLVKFNEQQFILIGEPKPDLRLEFGVALQLGSNEVVDLQPRRAKPVTFVNTSIAQCVEMVTLDFHYMRLLLPYQFKTQEIGVKLGTLYKNEPDNFDVLKVPFHEELEALYDYVICVLAKKLVADLKQVNPPAFAQEDAFWSQYLWDIESNVCPDVFEEDAD